MKKINLLFICAMIGILLVGCARSTVPNENESIVEAVQNSVDTDLPVPENEPVSENEDDTDNIQNSTQPDLPVFKYEFDPHVISKEYISVYGADIEECFYRFCDAVLNAENTFPCATKEKLLNVLSISRYCLPIASEFIDHDKCYVENGTGYLSYKIGNAELLNAISEFKNKVTEVITSAIKYDEEDFILAAELLTAVAGKDEYDFDAVDPDQFLIVQPYRAIMEDKGICQEIAGEYIYYLLQVGINATTCDGMTKDQEAHVWTVVELDGEHYHVDPTFTLQYKDSLAFFCIDDDMREQYGDFDADDFVYADSDIIHYEIHDQKYKDLWGAESYTIDRENRIIYTETFYSGEEKEYRY